jgi:putative acetyltransferase
MVNLRKAKRGEESEIMNLVKSVLSDYGLKTDPVTDQDISDLDQEYFYKNGWFSVLENSNKIIGTYGIYRIDKKICELRKMYLLPAYQGKGLGKFLLAEALKKAKELGYTEIILETNKVLDKAISLYGKNGFVEYKPAHLCDRCDFAMRKEL